MNEQNPNKPLEKDLKNGKKNKNNILYCSVKNCGREIEVGKEIRIEDHVYCPNCGAIVIKSVLGI